MNERTNNVVGTELKENERYFIKIGNCYADFLGLYHDLKIRADHNKAHPFTNKGEAIHYAKEYCGNSHAEIVIKTYNPPKKEEEDQKTEEEK